MIIKEFLPNPVGSDQRGEYIKIFNDSRQAVLLNGWSLKDASGKTYQLSGSLLAGQELVLPYSQTRIPLNNNGETIFLYDSFGKLADQLSYSGMAKEGQVIQRLANKESGAGRISATETAQNPNLLNANPPIAKVIFLDLFSAVILAGLGLYLILQLEKKLNIKLW